MPSPTLLRRIAEMTFEAHLTQQQIAKQLFREGYLKSANPKRVGELLDEATRWMLDVCRDVQGEQGTVDEAETLATQLRMHFDHLKDVIVVPTQLDKDSDHFDVGLVQAARRYFHGMVAGADQHQDELHVLVGGGQMMLNVFSGPLLSYGADKVHFYPAAIIGRTRTTASSPPGPEATAVAAWVACRGISGHLHYLTISSPDFLDDLVLEKDFRKRGSEAQRLLLEHNTALAQDRQIKRLLNDMKQANAAIAGFGMITSDPEAAGSPFSPPRVSATWVKALGPKRTTYIPTPRQSRTVGELLERHHIDAIAAGAVGEFAYCLFDHDGNGKGEWELFLTAGYPSSLDLFKEMVSTGSPVIGVGNLSTLPAMRAALRGKFINVLVTDVASAIELIPHHPKSIEARSFEYDGWINRSLGDLIAQTRVRYLHQDIFTKKLQGGLNTVRRVGKSLEWDSEVTEREAALFEKQMLAAREIARQRASEIDFLLLDKYNTAAGTTHAASEPSEGSPEADHVDRPERGPHTFFDEAVAFYSKGQLQQAVNHSHMASSAYYRWYESTSADVHCLISRSELGLGRIADAIANARAALYSGQYAGDEFISIVSLVDLARAYHYRGWLAEAKRASSQAEARRNSNKCDCSSIVWLMRLYRADMGAECDNGDDEVSGIVSLALEETVDDACRLLVLGSFGTTMSLSTRLEFLDKAIEFYRRMGLQIPVQSSLIRRANVYRLGGDYSNAEADLEEVFRLSLQSGARLALIDHNIEKCWCLLAQRATKKAVSIYEETISMIAELAYYRRKHDADRLRAALGEGVPVLLNDTAAPDGFN
jgi:DNA-binding transcriptional regulator LsrR (DeoR family)/tetratricopeptide (TPR) repeat protein